MHPHSSGFKVAIYAILSQNDSEMCLECIPTLLASRLQEEEEEETLFVNGIVTVGAV